MPYRRAVDEIARGVCMLSRTILSFSSSVQRRRRPVSTTSKPFNLSTVLIAVHKDCYTALILTRQGGPHRRETLICLARTNLSDDQKSVKRAITKQTSAAFF